MSKDVKRFFPGGEYGRTSESIEVWQNDNGEERMMLYVPDECPCCGASEYHYSHSIMLRRETLRLWIEWFGQILEELETSDDQ